MNARAAAIDAALAAAVAEGCAPGAVAAAADRDGEFYAGAHGLRAADGPAPMTPDTVFRLHSLTKAVGGVCAAALWEGGSLDLDAPVGRWAPEFDDLPVLTGWEGERPVLRPQRTRATVRQLATHCSGSVYDIWRADHRRLGAGRGAPDARAAQRVRPLAFDPGAEWAYGEGLDWLGLVIEAASGQPLAAFCADRILRPLGMTDTGFTLDEGRAARLAAAHDAVPGGFRVKPQASRGDAFASLGHGLHGTAGDYLRFLRMILQGGGLDGARILRPATVADLLLSGQIGDLRFTPLTTATPGVAADVDLFPGVPQTHTLIGPMTLRDVPGRRAAGSVGWAGIMNCWWWIDPSRGLAGVLLTQTLPFAGPGALRLFEAFERAVTAAAPLASRDRMV